MRGSGRLVFPAGAPTIQQKSRAAAVQLAGTLEEQELLLLYISPGEEAFCSPAVRSATSIHSDCLLRAQQVLVFSDPAKV